MPRGASLLVFAVACSGGGPAPAPTAGGAPATARSPEAEVTIRGAPVPAATDPDERLVFLRAGSVWMSRPDGAEPIQLTVRPHDAPDEAPALSPRGDALAWSGWTGSTHAVFVMSLDEMIPRQLTDDEDGDTEPTWSPDGERIAFMRGDPRERRDLYVVAAAGGAPTLLFEGDDDDPDHAGGPAWSPDGRTIALSADRRDGQGSLLWLFRLETRSLERLTAPRPGADFLRDQRPAWSPDGATIVFHSNRHVASRDDRAAYDLYRVAVDGSGLTRLTEGPGVATDPVYSPDGARIYFVSTRDRRHPYESDVYVMAARGGQARRVTRDERPQNTAPSTGVVRSSKRGTGQGEPPR